MFSIVEAEEAQQANNAFQPPLQLRRFRVRRCHLLQGGKRLVQPNERCSLENVLHANFTLLDTRKSKAPVFHAIRKVQDSFRGRACIFLAPYVTSPTELLK